MYRIDNYKTRYLGMLLRVCASGTVVYNKRCSKLIRTHWRKLNESMNFNFCNFLSLYIYIYLISNAILIDIYIYMNKNKSHPNI